MVLMMLLAALAACGLFLIIWAVREAMLVRLPDKAWHIICLSGTAQEAEQQVRTCLWLREYRGLTGMLLLVDDGLDAEAQITVRLLLRGVEGAVLCAAEQLIEHIQINE